MDINNETLRLPLHELCRMVNFIEDIDDDEYSDVEEEMFDEEDRKTNQEIYKLARFMILQSQMVETPIFHPRFDRDIVLDHIEDDTVGPSPLEMHQSILTLRESNGNTPLHVLCENIADTIMMKIIFECSPLEKSPETASATARDLVRMKNNHGCNPLHFLVDGFHPFSSLKLMLQYCSLGEETNGLDPRFLRDDDGDLPLHWAFARAVSPRRLKLLLSERHYSLLWANNKGILPMEEYVENHCEDFDFMDDDEKLFLWNKIQAMLMVVTGYQGFDTWSPLHAIASGVAFIPGEFWTMGLEFGRDSLLVYNDDGLLPLHVAVSTPPSHFVVSHIRLEKYMRLMGDIVLCSPEAARMPTSSGRLALHLAVESKQDEKVIDMVLEMDPNALLTIDPITQLPPFMLAAVDENNTLGIVYALFHQDPSMIRSTIR